MTTYLTVKREESPLKPYKRQLNEFYSLLHPIADVIRESQASAYPTAALGHFGVITLRLNILNKNKPLPILDAKTGKTAKLDEVDR